MDLSFYSLILINMMKSDDKTNNAYLCIIKIFLLLYLVMRNIIRNIKTCKKLPKHLVVSDNCVNTHIYIFNIIVCVGVFFKNIFKDTNIDIPWENFFQGFTVSSVSLEKGNVGFYPVLSRVDNFFHLDRLTGWGGIFYR